jgi:vacuolar-type H+-ATPase subunit B/Vma2
MNVIEINKNEKTEIGQKRMNEIRKRLFDFIDKKEKAFLKQQDENRKNME